MKKKLVIFFLLPLLIWAQDKPQRFKHLSLENGLSQSSVTCILKDSRGFMWFGTEDGLNKYDGHEFTIYRHQPDNPKSLSSSYINAILEGNDGSLWIGTKDGLNYFDAPTETFIRYKHDPSDVHSLSHNKVNSLFITDKRKLLIGTSQGLNIYDPESGFSRHETSRHIISMAQDANGDLWILGPEMLEKFRLDKDLLVSTGIRKALPGSFKSTLFSDSLTLWVGSSKGLIKFDPGSQNMELFSFYDTDLPFDNKNNVLSIIKGKEDTLLVGTASGGLVRFNKTIEAFDLIIQDPYRRTGLNSNSIRSLYMDECEILWLGTFSGGVNKYDPAQFSFEHLKHLPGNNKGLSEKTVRSVLQDSDGELWIGTHGGLNRLGPSSPELKVYTYSSKDPQSISSNTVRALCEDQNGTIWAGTWENGFCSFDKRTESFRRYISFPGQTDSIGQVRTLISDKHNNIWVGGNGLWKFNPQTNVYSSYHHDKNDPNSLSNNSVNRLYFDKKGRLWIGTINGLNCLDTSSNKLKRYEFDPEDKFSLSHGNITSIAEDKNGAIWVGTYGGGLNKLDISKANFKHYDTSNGLLNDVIYGILTDRQGFIWFSSNAGLGRLDPVRDELRYFGTDYGVQSYEFNAGAYFKAEDGKLFFGGINGLNSFYPATINNSRNTAKIVFTGFQILDDKNIGTDKLLEEHISRTDNIELSHYQNNFSFKFAELNYSDNADNTYEYKLEGLSKKWQDLGKERQITLASLDPGSYTLHLRVTDDLTKKTSVDIFISPPLWRSHWAYLIYAVLVVLMVFFTFRHIHRVKDTQRGFEAKIKSLENDLNTSVQFQNRNHINSMPLRKIKMMPINEKFFKKAIEVVENHMEDSRFDVEQFANEMFLSRSQLHRRIKSLTGYSTTKFIRLIRLKRAAQLLAANTGSVSEIAYKVGFDNIGYFSKCFSETFGKPPSQYLP
ncbi:helix-turn-helix domain-containing protein [Leptobacterium flavescens]|uniref:Helix-turn-helix domain-containing protein n=1 Tax=Leptobacterium flavescens TaxID=472055 RepID=A0A6P0UFB6_9FLAO|nr:two-component regulator propeller domain-containing protein [Leptobacterium flavescens]NER11935.1 helix-turn-helix domain-containing protein [Leptobacterium flavescens]